MYTYAVHLIECVFFCSDDALRSKMDHYIVCTLSGSKCKWDRDKLNEI